MILTIKGPTDFTSVRVSVKDIVRLETCSLKFFGKKVYNLYIIIKAGADEHFYLLSYIRQDNFKKAFASISGILQDQSRRTSIIDIMPGTEEDQLSTVIQ